MMHYHENVFSQKVLTQQAFRHIINIVNYIPKERDLCGMDRHDALP